jgi:hypothetical protein
MYREDRAIGEAAATTDPGGGAAVFNVGDVYSDTMRAWLSARLPTRLGLTPSTFTRSDRVEPTEIRSYSVTIPVTGVFTRPIQEEPKYTAPRPENLSADASLDRVLLFFPDPWHKSRHHKRRIVQPAFAELVRQKLKVGGVLHMATDWEAYAEHMLEVMNVAPGYHNQAADGGCVPRPAERPITKFERRGERLGHGVWDLKFQRVD